MSRKEKIKTSIDIIKAFLITLTTALFGIFAFLVINIDKISLFQALACICGIVLIVIFFSLLLRKIIKLLDELGEL